MRKFTTIILAVVLCLAAFAVVASATTECVVTNSPEHDWSAWRTVDNTGLQKRTCACGAFEEKMPVPEHVHNIAYVPAAEACHVEGTAEFWYCTDPTCEIVFADEALTQVTNRKNLAIAPDAELVYVPEAKACHADGKMEYWYCTDCEAVYADAEGTQLTNHLNLTIPATIELAHVPASQACHKPGCAEYWYCVKCDAVYADAEGTQLTNRKNLETAPVCELAYTAKVEPTATENGMNEYWYCAGCECFFTDAEGKQIIAYLSLTIPATGEVTEPTTPDTPATPDEPAVPTGDSAIFFIVAVVAVATLGVATVSFKKREN